MKRTIEEINTDAVMLKLDIAINKMKLMQLQADIALLKGEQE